MKTYNYKYQKDIFFQVDFSEFGYIDLGGISRDYDDGNLGITSTPYTHTNYVDILNRLFQYVSDKDNKYILDKYPNGKFQIYQTHQNYKGKGRCWKVIYSLSVKQVKQLIVN